MAAEKKEKPVSTGGTKKPGVRMSSCTCKSDFQDKLYGAGQRVFSIATKKKDGDKCSVCGRRKV